MPRSSTESFKMWKVLHYFLVSTCSSCTWALNRNPVGFLKIFLLRWNRDFCGCRSPQRPLHTKHCWVPSTAQCPCLVWALCSCKHNPCDPQLPHLPFPGVLWLFSFQTAWVLTSPGYSPSSRTSLPFSTLWTKWSVSLGFVPGILKTMAALAGLRWKGSPWMKLMSKSYPWEVLFCPDWQ